MNYPYLRRLGVAAVATVAAPFVGVALGRGIYALPISWSDALGFTPDRTGNSAETLGAAMMAFCITCALLEVIWAWATNEATP